MCISLLTGLCMDEQGNITFFLDFIVTLMFGKAIMATEAGQDEEPVAGTSFSQLKENMDMHLTMAEQMQQMAANDRGHHEQIPEMGSRA